LATRIHRKEEASLNRLFQKGDLLLLLDQRNGAKKSIAAKLWREEKKNLKVSSSTIIKSKSCWAKAALGRSNYARTF
jgi:hypothetical protein